jgi:hypothetical protein
MRTARLLTATILAATGLVAIGATTEAANASTKDLKASHTHVMKSETFKLSGGMSTHVARAVKLQYRNHSSDAWTTKSTTTSGSGGTFAFFPSTTKTRFWRYYSPATASLASIKGNSLKVSVVSQKVQSITVIRQTQCHLGALPTSDVTVVYDFYPSRVGRLVDFGSSAIDTSDYEDASGKVAFTFNPGTTNGTFDAVATAEALGEVSSLSAKVVHYSITSCVITPI